MKQADVRVGANYWATVSGKLTIIRINDAIVRQGYGRRPDRMNWLAKNLGTGKDVCIKSAQRLRREATEADLKMYRRRQCPPIPGNEPEEAA